MERFIRFYNQNRKTIYKWIAVIALSYLFLRIINSIIEQNNKENMAKYRENTVNNNKLVNEVVLNNTTSSTNKESKKYGNILDNFLEYCQKQEDYEKAYELLSEKTKQESSYNTKEKFIQNFINKFFNSKTQYVIDELNNTYVIGAYANNILETGNTEELTTKYIKIEDKKINIQDYIINSEVGKKVTKEDVVFNIKDATYYYDYVEYKVYITNSGNKTIDIKNIYLQLSKTKVNNQSQNENLQIKPYESKILNLKFNVKYKQINTIKNMAIETENDKIEIEL